MAKPTKPRLPKKPPVASVPPAGLRSTGIFKPCYHATCTQPPTWPLLAGTSQTVGDVLPSNAIG
jgi:hypothetical protein